jgi:hypothetical protein
VLDAEAARRVHLAQVLVLLHRTLAYTKGVGSRAFRTTCTCSTACVCARACVTTDPLDGPAVDDGVGEDVEQVQALVAPVLGGPPA